MDDHHDLVKQMLDAGHATETDVIELDGRLAWKEAAACRSADGTTRLLFQVVPEPKTAKNRMHLDLHVADGRRDAEVERLIGLGATFLHDGRQGPYRVGDARRSRRQRVLRRLIERAHAWARSTARCHCS